MSSRVSDLKVEQLRCLFESWDFSLDRGRHRGGSCEAGTRVCNQGVDVNEVARSQGLPEQLAVGASNED